MPKNVHRDKKSRNAFIAVVTVGAALGLYWMVQPRTRPDETQSSVNLQPETTPGIPENRLAESAIPPFHDSAEAAKPFPLLVPAAYFRSVPLVERAYRVADEIPGVIAQQPCYCHCDKFGHHSLLDCYASDHGAGWLICVKEVLLAEKMTMQGKSAAAIREAILRGDWRDLDVSSPTQEAPAPKKRANVNKSGKGSP